MLALFLVAALVSRAGLQPAVVSHGCGQSSDLEQLCGRAGYPFPRLLSVVRPHERLRLTGASGRYDVEVHRLGCIRRVAYRFTVGSDGRFRANLPPGLWDLQLATARVRAAVGLWVSREHRRTIVPVKSVYLVGC